MLPGRAEAMANPAKPDPRYIPKPIGPGILVAGMVVCTLILVVGLFVASLVAG